MKKTFIAQALVESGAGSSSLVFNNIPQDYDDLYILGSLRNYTGSGHYADVDFNVNGETSRMWQGLYSISAGAAANTLNNNINIVSVTNGTGSTANVFSNFSALITNYKDSGMKSISSDAMAENVSTSLWHIAVAANTVTSSSAITSITMVATSGATFAQHSVAYLYGVTRGSDGITAVS